VYELDLLYIMQWQQEGGIEYKITKISFICVYVGVRIMIQKKTKKDLIRA